MSRDIDLWAEAEPFARIEPAADGTWQPAEAGMLAALLPVWTPDLVEEAEIVDLVAWELMGSGSPWWLRRGAVSYLGDRALDRARLLDRPLRVVATPRQWLSDRGESC